MGLNVHLKHTSNVTDLMKTKYLTNYLIYNAFVYSQYFLREVR
jgi:hypothetical protein